jgi:hypothetical protein
MQLVRSFQALMILTVLLGCADLQAQMFGRPRSLGRPLARRGLDADMETVGQITGGERFLRGNRGRASFVGADRSENQSFVGGEQARTSGVIVSSTAGITPPPDRSSQINRPLQQPSSGQMYLPKIRLELGDETGSPSMLSHIPVTGRVQKSVQLASQRPIVVSVVGRTAILRGGVASESEKDLAGTLALFEPGISQVVNQLWVQDRPVPPPPQPPAISR